MALFDYARLLGPLSPWRPTRKPTTLRFICIEEWESRPCGAVFTGWDGRFGFPLCPECGSGRTAYFNQQTIAFMAEWLTKYLLDGGGARREASVKREAERIELPWPIVAWVGKELGFVAEDRWRLPNDHPFRNLDFAACPSSTPATSRFFPDGPGGADAGAQLDASSAKNS